jgi:2-polyprenyl-3-methyl-5-hydroxy-6-metoxy-1,4-benzoquinol methylase
VSQDTDRDWNALAEIDPYCAVLTHDEFRGAVAADRDTLNAFLESGRAYVNHIWDAIESVRGGRFSPERALDFGCGVGRIAIPLAARCGTSSDWTWPTACWPGRVSFVSNSASGTFSS